MSVQENTINILHELESNALKIDDAQAAQFISQIRNARHIFCRSWAQWHCYSRFANRLLHLGFQ